MGRPVVLDNETCYTVRYDVRRSEWHAAKVTVNDKQIINIRGRVDTDSSSLTEAWVYTESLVAAKG